MGDARMMASIFGAALAILALVVLVANESDDSGDILSEGATTRRPDPDLVLFAMARELKRDAAPPASQVAQQLALEAVTEVDRAQNVPTFLEQQKDDPASATANKIMHNWAAEPIHVPAWLQSSSTRPSSLKTAPSVDHVVREARQTAKRAQAPLSGNRPAKKVAEKAKKVAEKAARDVAKRAQRDARVMAAKATRKAMVAAKHNVKSGRAQGEAWLKDMGEKPKPSAALAATRATQDVLAAAHIAASAESRAAQVLRRASKSVLGGPVVYSTAAAKKRDMQDLMDDTSLANSQAMEDEAETKLVRAQIAQTQQQIRLEEARGVVPTNGGAASRVNDEVFLEVFTQKPSNLKSKLKAAKTAAKAKTFQAKRAKIAAKAAIKDMTIHKGMDRTVTHNHAAFLKAQVKQAQKTLKKAAVTKASMNKATASDAGVVKYIKNAEGVLKKKYKSKDGPQGPPMPHIDFNKIGAQEADIVVARQQRSVQRAATNAGYKAGMALANKQLKENPNQVKAAIEAKLKRFETKPAVFDSHRMAKRAVDEAEQAAANVLSRTEAKTKGSMQHALARETAAAMKPFSRDDIIKQARTQKIIRAVSPIASHYAGAIKHNLHQHAAHNKAVQGKAAKAAQHAAESLKKALAAKQVARRISPRHIKSKASKLAKVAKKDVVAQRKAVRKAVGMTKLHFHDKKGYTAPKKKKLMNVKMISLRVQRAINQAASQGDHAHAKQPAKKVQKLHKTKNQHTTLTETAKEAVNVVHTPKAVNEVHTPKEAVNVVHTPKATTKVLSKRREQSVKETTKEAVAAFLAGMANKNTGK